MREFYFGRIPSPIDSRDYKLRAFIPGSSTSRKDASSMGIP